jgi:hypothetical protein
MLAVIYLKNMFQSVKGLINRNHFFFIIIIHNHKDYFILVRFEVLVVVTMRILSSGT